jgi:glycosyltransferase involved in cell wall biosynthesis
MNDQRGLASSTGRSLRLLVIADAKIPVPPEGYGGAERIVALLCQGLAAHGHHVTLMAAKGSRDYGRLVTYSWAGRKPYPYRVFCKLDFFTRSLLLSRRIDAAISFARVDYLLPLLRLGVPIVCNFQNPIQRQEVDFLERHARGPLRLVSISDAQRAGFSGDRWRTIHNAVDTTRLRFAPSPDGEPYLAFLGRLTANKGVDDAIRVARATGRRLKIAGNVSDEPGGREFFERKVRPELDDRISWMGEVDDDRKSAFLGGAEALLVPIRWDEPFGIVVPEALACGTPVIATARGSMPELIAHGVNGYLVPTTFEMAAGVERLHLISRASCRADADTRFSAVRMVEDYLTEIYGLLNADAIPTRPYPQRA